MFTDPDLYRYIARQREAELIAEADNDRLAKAVRQRNRGRAPDGRSKNAR
jgi:hypothetical protein